MYSDRLGRSGWRASWTQSQAARVGVDARGLELRDGTGAHGTAGFTWYAEELLENRGQLGTRHDQIDLPLFEQEFRRLKALRQFLANNLLDYLRSSKTDMCFRFSHDHIAEGCEGGAYAAEGGIGEQEKNGTPTSASFASAAAVFAICIRETIPSCIRAPPEAQQTRTGVRISTPNSTDRVTFSPTTEPMLPPMNVKSSAHMTIG